MPETEETLIYSGDVFALRDELVELLVENLSVDTDMVAQINGHDQCAEAIIKFFAERLSPAEPTGGEQTHG